MIYKKNKKEIPSGIFSFQGKVMVELEDVYAVITEERVYQDKKWGIRSHEIPTWFLILRKELDEAEEAWLKKGDRESIIELSQVVAVGVACMQEHGAINRYGGDKLVDENPFFDPND